MASLIAIPLAYLAIQKWLENYAFSTTIRWWMLALPVLVGVLTAVLINYKYSNHSGSFGQSGG